MKRLFIIKVGTTFASTRRRFGDFDDWTREALGPVSTETEIIDAEHGAPLPAPEVCAGVVVTGAHAMVTERHPWSLAVEKWIPALIDGGVPFFGICYGHQLLAKAMGGEVGFHPGGQEIGTVGLELLPVCAADPLFHSLPARIAAHVVHSQTALHLPKDAVLLAASAHEPHHAFRVGHRAWGVQFHPEYTNFVMRDYIQAGERELEGRGIDISFLLKAIAETPHATLVLRRFGRFVDHAEASNRQPRERKRRWG